MDAGRSRLDMTTRFFQVREMLTQARPQTPRFANFLPTTFLAATLSAATLLTATFSAAGANAPVSRTQVSIAGEKFLINGQPTFAGRTWAGVSIEGRLMNSRMVQGNFDDLNPATRTRWTYPDGRPWDPERNTREFIAAMPEWRRHGLNAFTLNLQGGSPEGYSAKQPWHNSAIQGDGSLRPDYLARTGRILDRANELGMVVVLGIFYFGQDERIQDEAAVIRAVDATVDWLYQRGDRHVLIEINNETNVKYDHPILQPERVHELIARVRARRAPAGHRLLVGTSYGGGKIPGENVVTVSDFILIHGNGVKDPARITEMVAQTRALPSWRQQPIVFNEDDHFDFDKPLNNFVAAIRAGASWGFFDFRMKGENFPDGYQSVPVDWGIHSPRKRAFFAKLQEITGGLK
ncbi:MAG: hypothetical protein RL077_777 [Verrucomicrobiota bacterium]